MTRRAFKVAILLFLLCNIHIFQNTAHALPTHGTLRLSLHAGLKNAYVVDASRFTGIANAFRTTIDEVNTFHSVSSTNFFGAGALAELQYVLHKSVALAFRAGFDYNFSGRFSPTAFRIPLLLAVNIGLADWLEIQPGIGVNINRTTRTTLLTPNIDISLRLRIIDRFDISSGFLYGALGGMYFGISMRLFNFFSFPVIIKSNRVTIG